MREKYLSQSRLSTVAFVLLSLSAIACAKPQDEKVLVVPAEFSNYVQEFEAEAGSQGKTLAIDNLIVQYGTFERANQKASCRHSTPPVVTIDKTYWDRASEIKRKNIIFHELGHCILKRSHTNQTDNYGNPVSIMNYELLDPRDLENNQDQYMAELFKTG